MRRRSKRINSSSMDSSPRREMLGLLSLEKTQTEEQASKWLRVYNK
jgi:hypothetical protein